MDGAETSYYGYTENPSPPVVEEGWAGYIALFLVIILIVAFIIYLVVTGGTTSFVQTKYNIIQGTSTGSTESMVGAAGNYYIVNTSATNLALTVTVPTDPLGQEFVVDNSKSKTKVTLNTASSFVIPQKTVASFVWTTTSSASVLSLTTLS